MDQEENHFNDPEASNNSLFSTQFNPILKPEKSTKKPAPIIIPIEQRLSKAQNQLISQISIISSERLHATQHFTSQLKNFRYQKNRKNLFGQPQNRIEGDRHSLIQTLNDLFQKFKSEKKNTFYIILSGASHKGVLYFVHKQITNKKVQSNLIISLKKNGFASQIQKQEILFENLEKTAQEKQKFLIRNKYISIFWGFFINYLIYNDVQFELISNFPFLNSLYILPHETYNGIENRQQYSYVAKVKQNIFGKEERQAYLMKIQGLWLKQNITALVQKVKSLTNNRCQILFIVHPITQTLFTDKKQLKFSGKI